MQADNTDGRRARVTIRQVAEQAGVSIATVSRVVNGHSDASSQTREAVTRVLRELRAACAPGIGVRAWDYSACTQPGWPTTTAQQQLFDPLWGMNDPAAGTWFPQQALQLAQDANPAR